MTYAILIVILTAFAKKNEVKIGFENNKEMTTVMPLLSFDSKENDVKQQYQKDYYNISFITIYYMTHGMCNKKDKTTSTTNQC